MDFGGLFECMYRNPCAQCVPLNLGMTIDFKDAWMFVSNRELK